MKGRTFAGALVAVLLLGPAAHAGTLASATWLQVTQGVPMTRTTGQLGASGSSTVSSVAVSLAYPAFSLSFFIPKTSMGVLDLHVKVTQGGPQNITATPAMGGADQGVPGTVIVMSAHHIAKGVNASMYNFGINTLLAVPISVGQAGQFTNQFIVLGITHTITVDFFAWTPGIQVFAGLSTGGVALPTLTVYGSFNLNGAGVGTVTLVSPTKVSVDGALAQRRTVTFTTLKLTFVPEPSTLVLFCAAAAALVFTRRS